ncbi:MAG: Lrp/AsnC ligand binding domain-containing protein [Candidatus Bathyarchaeia archaeon]
MVRACILIRVSSGVERATVEAVKKVRGVKKAYNVFGRYDVVAFAEAPTLRGISAVSGRVNSTEGIKSTETLIETR